MSGKTSLYSNWQLGFLVLCGAVGVGAMLTAFFILLALPETPTFTTIEVLCVVNSILGLILWLRSMHLLHTDLRKRWFP